MNAGGAIHPGAVTPAAGGHGKLSALQVLRGFAALAVVLHHALRAVTVNKPADILVPPSALLSNPVLIELGAFGVDIFFVLSGFLMIYISEPYVRRRRPISDFLAHRVIRVWPLYALVTAGFCAALVAHSLATGVVSFDLAPVRLLSFVFIPSFNARGLLQPILGVGWTLNYEVLFYVCFALALVLARERVLLGISAILAVLYATGLALPAGGAAQVFLSNAVLFEFIFGGLIATGLIRQAIPLRRPGLWFAAGAILLAIGAGWPADEGYRLAARGLPAACFFIGMLALERRVAWPRALLLLGNASYSLYLIHIMLVYQVAPIVMRLAVAHGLAAGAAPLGAAAAVLVSLASGLLCYWAVEQPLLKACQGLYRRYSRPTVGAPVSA